MGDVDSFDLALERSLDDKGVSMMTIAAILVIVLVGVMVALYFFRCDQKDVQKYSKFLTKISVLNKLFKPCKDT